MFVDRGAGTSVVRVSQKLTRRSSLARYRAERERATFALAPCFRDRQVQSSGITVFVRQAAFVLVDPYDNKKRRGGKDTHTHTHTGGSGARGTKIIAGNASATRNTMRTQMEEFTGEICKSDITRIRVYREAITVE